MNELAVGLGTAWLMPLPRYLLPVSGIMVGRGWECQNGELVRWRERIVEGKKSEGEKVKGGVSGGVCQ